MDRLENDLFRENIKIASLSVRIGAYLIDVILLSLTITLFFSQAQQEKLIIAIETTKKTYSLQTTTQNNSEILENMRKAAKDALETTLIYMAIYIGLEIVYFFFFVYFYGATIGQIILRIRVIDSYRFDKPTLHVCMKRALTKCIFGSVLYVGFIVAFVDRYYRALHDRMSNTIVVAS